MKMVICPFCKTNIDDDSLFCDQCGQEILICPKCSKPGRGKVCTADGTPLVSAKNRITTPPISVDAPELHLINRTLGLDLKITKDVLIGRTKGDFVDIFGKYSNISGEHLKITFDPQQGWMVTDLNSTNGTKYNDTPLIPMQPQVLSDKSYLTLAYLGAGIEFYVEIRKKIFGKTGTARG